MNNVTGITNYNMFSNVQNTQGNPIVYKPNIANNTTSSVNSKTNTDYFVQQSKPSSNATNAILMVFDDFLAKVAPKLFLDKFISEHVISEAVRNNPNIAQILAAKGLTPEIHMENVQGKISEHFLATYDKARELGANLPLDEFNALMQAALLHDIGKVLIPPEILNKPAKLTPEEKEIVDLHAQLGYEILKTTTLQPKVVEAVRTHHFSADDPQKQNNYISQILSVADVYSALKEERPYKAKLPEEQVRNIMQSDEKLNQEIVNDIFIPQDISNFDSKKANYAFAC